MLKIPFPVFTNFVRKKSCENVAVNLLQFIMDGDGKHSLPMHLRLDQLKIVRVSSKRKSMKEIGRLKPEII